MATFEVGVVGTFEAAHRLVGDFGPAARQHGHTYRVEAAVRGTSIGTDGTLFDVTRLQQALDAARDALHYRDLADVPALASQNTTVEVVARHIFGQVAPRLRGLGLTILRVQVWESPTVYAAFEDDLEAGEA